MSEALDGVPSPPPLPPPRDAAVVVLFRRVTEGVEVFWVEREERLSFAGGFYAFPGGRKDESDESVAAGAAPLLASPRFAGGGNELPLPAERGEGRGEGPAVDGFIVCAARELFEETGVLLARGAEVLVPEALHNLRRELLAERLTFAQLLEQHGLALDASDFLPAGRWVTPPYLPRGFDARFFLVEARAYDIATIWPGELTGGEWISPAEALKRWEAAKALLHPPNLHALQVLSKFAGVTEAQRALSSPPHVTNFIAERIEFQRGVMLFPLVTPTLPPATHTNCYLLGTQELLIVDPGAPDSDELTRLVNFIDSLRPEGFSVKAILLTHHHGDHLGGVAELSSRLGAPVWAHARTADRCPVPVARLLEDGEVLTLAGPMEMKWRVLHTPGHARGHVTLVDEATKSAVVGDMVAGVGTIVIDPPEGEMAEYLAQLQRLEALPVGAIYPAHGPVIPNGVGKLREYQQHRAWREAKVLDALASFGDAGVDLERLVEKAYDDVASFVWPIAQRNTAAIIEKLIAEGRARRSGALVIAIDRRA